MKMALMARRQPGDVDTTAMVLQVFKLSRQEEVKNHRKSIRIYIS